MRGGVVCDDWRTIESETCLTVPFVGGLDPVSFFWRGAYGKGPSSSTQSSISEVLRPNDGPMGDGDLDTDFVDIEGVVGGIGK